MLSGVGGGGRQNRKSRMYRLGEVERETQRERERKRERHADR